MKKQLLSLMLLALFAGNVRAQVSAYGFTQTSGTYGSAFTGSFIGAPLQFGNVNSVNLPFGFLFNSNTYNSVDICSNGFLSFGSPSGTEVNPISDNTTSEVISPFGQDLWMGLVTTGDIAAGSNSITNVSFPGGISVGDSIFDLYGEFNASVFTVVNISGSTIVINTTANSSVSGTDIFVLNGAIRENVTGTTPNRIYTVEYRNFNRYVYDEIISFKVKLYETSGKIDFVYGPSTIGADAIPVEVGLKGSSNSDYKSRMVGSSNTWATSSAATSILDVCEVDNSKYPASGLTYIWAPGCAAPSVAIVPSTTVSCSGQAVVLTAGGNAATYTWTGSGSAPQITVNPTSTTSYTLVGTTNNCTSSAVYTQSVAPSPTVIGTPSSGTVCAGVSTTLTATGANSYTWVNVGNGVTQVVTPTVSGTYTVIGETGGCTDNDQVSITVNPGPVVQVAQTHSVICTNPQQSGTLTASGASSYNWSNGSVTAVIVVSPTTTTNYVVTGLGANGCSTTFTITQKAANCNGIAESSIQSMVRAFPNPFQNNIQVENVLNGKLNVKAIDITGRVVYQEEHENANILISTSSWKAGLYFIEARSGNEIQIVKMIKE